MFGHNDNQQQDQNQDDTAAQTGVPSFTPPPVVEPTPSATLDATADKNMELPGNLTTPEPSTDDSAAPAPATSAPAAPPSPAPSAAPAPTTPVDDLVSIKQQALQHLSPLVDHLDQTPEEHFRTAMMMIQATDDSSKIKDAYEAAQQITDEKVRAQALLDVVNEINYFTQQQQKQD